MGTKKTVMRSSLVEVGCDSPALVWVSQWNMIMTDDIYPLKAVQVPTTAVSGGRETSLTNDVALSLEPSSSRRGCPQIWTQI